MNNVVNYDELVAFLKQASLFEVYRLSVAINNELENPIRVSCVINKLKEGDVVEYFEAKTQSFIKARILQKSLKYVSVQHIDDGKCWKIPYYMLKIDARDFVFEAKSKGLNPNTIQVGDIVGFTRETDEIIGKIERINSKTVSIITADGQRWRVAYSLLYSVIEGEKSSHSKLLSINLNKT